MKRISQLFRRPKNQSFVTIVSGLPRSGTSMMMKVLEAGGLPVLTDNIRSADDDNPKGYYEYERVKKLPEGDTAWLAEAQGKTVKVISALLEYLPQEYSYRVIFMHRNVKEILASQKKMLERSGKPTDKVSDEKLAEMYQKHLVKVESWLAAQPNVTTLYINYNTIMQDPLSHLREVNQFLGYTLSEDKMAGMIDPSLYRQKA
jgi:Sulfotransferase domain